MGADLDTRQPAAHEGTIPARRARLWYRDTGLGQLVLVSWGGLLAMEYAIRHPERVSHMILMNTAFARGDDRFLFQEERRGKWPEAVARPQALAASAAFQEGDPHAVAAYYRVHVSTIVRQPELLEAIVDRVCAGMTPGSILKARAIELRLLDDTWLSDGCDLLPALRGLRIPTLVILGGADFIPLECVSPIVEAIPGARLALIPDCGHFAYLECPDAVRTAIDTLCLRTADPLPG